MPTPSLRRRNGFTLLEMLVALTVMGVAVAVFVGMFDMALTVSRNSRDRAACLDIAQAVLDDVALNPQDYRWASGKDLQPAPAAGGKPAGAAPPRALLPGDRAKRRMEAKFGRYDWTLYSRKAPRDNPLPVLEVTVMVRAGESSPAVVLTTLVPDTAGAAAGGTAP